MKVTKICIGFSNIISEPISLEAYEQTCEAFNRSLEEEKAQRDLEAEIETEQMLLELEMRKYIRREQIVREEYLRGKISYEVMVSQCNKIWREG